MKYSSIFFLFLFVEAEHRRQFYKNLRRIFFEGLSMAARNCSGICEFVPAADLLCGCRFIHRGAKRFAQRCETSRQKIVGRLEGLFDIEAHLEDIEHFTLPIGFEQVVQSRNMLHIVTFRARKVLSLSRIAFGQTPR